MPPFSAAALARASMLAAVAITATAACGEVTHDSDPDSWPDAGPNFEDDTGLPETLLTSTPELLSNQALAEFQFSSDPVGASFECTIDDAEPAPCSSPFRIEVAEGEHNFEVAAIDSGVRDPTPEVFTWTVDLTPPDTTITSAPPALDNSVSVSFEFESTEEGTFACALDGGAPAPCSSPYLADSLADGAHQFVVTATDLAGNEDPTPAIHDWTVDSSNPDTRIDDGPTGPVSSDAATFEFSSPDAGAGAVFECAVDGAAFATCTSPYDVIDLDEGVHEFEVRVTDATGNVDPTPATRSWTVDTVAPVVTITSGPTGTTSMNQPSFAFTVSGSPGSVECRIDSDPFAACTSPFTPATALGDGDRRFQVRARDAAGNSSAATRNFTVDTEGPTVSITSGPTGLTNDATPTFGFNVGGAPTAIDCRIDSGSFARCDSSYTAGALADGDHRFTVRARDAAGNTTTANRDFTVDATPPTVSISSGPNGLTRDNTPTFSFTASGSPSSVQCRIDRGTYANCSGTYTAATLSEGAHTFSVRARDAAGNESSASRGFTVDTVAPSVTITAGPSGPTNDNTPTFRFSVSGSPSSIQCRIDGGSYTSCSSSYTSSALSDGNHTFYVRGTDAAGNSSTRSRRFSVDTVRPGLRITDGPANGSTILNASRVTFGFTTSGAAGTRCRLWIDGNTAPSYSSCSSPRRYNIGFASYVFQVQAYDAAGNTRTLSRRFVNVELI